MGFHFIHGLMGGGKSYLGAEICYTCLEEGGVVHTNLPLNRDTIEENGWEDRVVMLKGAPSDWVKVTIENGEEIYSSDIFQMGKEGAENVVVVDETAIKFSSEKQQSDAAKNHAIFCLIALCRHAGLDVQFIAQRKNHVAKRIRDLAETETLCENCGNIPYLGWLIKPMMGDLRRTIYKDGERYASCYIRLKKKICDFYQTHGMRENLEMKSGGERVKKASSWSKRGAVFILGGLALGISGMIYGTAETYKNVTGSRNEPAKPAAPDTASTKKVERHDRNGNTKELVMPQKPPAPKGGILLEWEAYDEHVLAGALMKSGQRVVITRGGRRLFVGGCYEGQRIELQFQVADWYYFQCQNKRVIVVRPMRPEEREVLPPVTVPGLRPIDIEQTNPVDGLVSGLKSPL